MTPDKMKPVNAPASGTGSTSGSIPGEDPSYPPYAVEFSGGGMSAPILVTGPHTFAFPQGGGSMSVSLTRNPSDGTKPNLAIKFTTIP
jgi:hypothetical protein